MSYQLKFTKASKILIAVVFLGLFSAILLVFFQPSNNILIEKTFQILQQSTRFEDLILTGSSQPKLEQALVTLQSSGKTLTELTINAPKLETLLDQVPQLTVGALLTDTGRATLRAISQTALVAYQDFSEANARNHKRLKTQLLIILATSIGLMLVFFGTHLEPSKIKPQEVAPIELETDVTQVDATRVELEKVAVALRESKARNLAITRAALDAIITVDQFNQITEFNPAAEQIFDIPFDLVLGRKLSEVIFPEELRATFEHRIAGLIRDAKTLVSGERLEMTAARVGGKEFPIEFSIVQLGDDPPTFASFIRDITERKAAEEHLKERTSQLDSVFNVSPDGFLIFDAKGKAIDVNPAFLAMTGLERNLVIGNNEYMISDEHEINSVLEYLSDPNLPFLSSLDSSESQTDTLTLIRPNLRVLKRTLRVMRNQDVTIGRVMYLRDVTHETEVSRMKSEFLATAAHELRTPMASIYGFAELLMMQDFDEATRKDLIETIHRQANRLVNLLNELLDLARIEARTGKDFKITAQPLAPLIEATAIAFSPADQRHRLEIVLPPDLPSMAVDGAKFQQALGNVISNAFKYSPQGGAIVLSVLEPGLVNDLPSPFQLGISVRDHGLGLTNEQLARVFERFYRADDSGNIPGTGLGLNLVKEIIERHGGQVEIQSQFGAGTEVILWFPKLAMKA